VGYYGLLAAGIAHAAFIVLFWWLDIPLLMWINVGSVLLYIFAILGLGPYTLHTKDDSVIGWLVYGELLIHNILASYLLSTAAGFQFYIYVLVILPFFIVTYTKTVYILRTLGALAAAMWLDVSSVFYVPKVEIEPTYIVFFHHINLFIFLSVLAFLSYLYVRLESEQYAMLSEKSNKDPLTEVYNRRYIQNLVIDTPRRFGILLIDIDFFKQINDKHGHIGGDAVIRHVANIIVDAVSPEGVTARWGGEEFLVFFDEIDADTLKLYARRVLRAVRESSFERQGTSVSVTVTVGGAIRENGEPFESTLVRADEALYEGKRAGRDQVCIKA
jgi:diguanylate cyclase (GGDEF)-like protein